MTQRTLDHSGLDRKNCCIACGIPYNEHLGLFGTCFQLQEIRDLLEDVLDGKISESEAHVTVQIDVAIYNKIESILNEKDSTQKGR